MNCADAHELFCEHELTAGRVPAVVNCSEAAAAALAARIGGKRNTLGGSLDIRVSGDPAAFAPLAERFLQETGLRVRRKQKGDP